MNSPYIVITQGYGSLLAITQGYGQAVAHVLAADAGSFAIAGQDSAAGKGKFLDADTGPFVVSGDGTATPGGVGPTAELLISGRVLAAGTGIFLVDGQDTSAGKGTLILAAGAGTFLVAGEDTAAGIEPFIVGRTGRYVISGAGSSGAGSQADPTSGLTVGRVLVADTGPFIVSGAGTATPGGVGPTAELLIDAPIVAGTGVFIVSGDGSSGAGAGGDPTAGILIDRVLVAAPGEFLVTGNVAGLNRAFTLIAGAGAFFVRGDAALLTHNDVSHDRDRDIIYAAGECLKATGAYDFVTLTGPPEESGSLSGSTRIAALEYSKEEHLIDGDYAGCIIVHGWILMTFIAIEPDPQAADETCELMANIACNALDGQSLDLITHPGFTQVTQGKWLKRKAPERRKTAFLEYRYLVANWNDFGTLE